MPFFKKPSFIHIGFLRAKPHVVTRGDRALGSISQLTPEDTTSTP
ncbi:hypothetical protein [Chroococcidiopsis thermalis]|nr:hypothetical protein [Chroococcidiopsis thermalis]